MALELHLSVLLLLFGVEHATAQQGSGVYFSLNGIVYFNNSVIPLTDIGTEGSTTPLVCNTDLRPCCIFRGENPLRVEGHWYYPNGTEVSGNGNFDIRRDIFRTRGQFDGTVNIFRRSMDITSPFGRYCCEIPNAMMEMQTLCANIAPSGFSFVINATPSVGQSYSLTCSVTGGTVSSYQWRKDGAVLQGQTTEVLSFSSLTLSDAGRYSCEITVTAASESFTAIQNQSVIIQIPVPTSVSVMSNPATPIQPVGSNVTLTCTVMLSPSATGSLTVNTVLNGPNGFSENRVADSDLNTDTYISTAMVYSFGRNQSGNYTCSATVSSTSSFITTSFPQMGTERVTVGVYLIHNGMLLANNSAVFISDIGDTTNTRLQCVTDRLPCCDSEPNGAGEWFFPEKGGVVPTQGTTFRRNRGDDGTVSLNRVNSAMSPTGHYCCVVPDATDVMQWACVIIFVVEISDGGVTPTAGQSYTLTCGTSGASGFTYQWIITNGSILQGQTSRMLSFTPLRLSDGGRYTCVATMSSRQFSDSFDVVTRVSVPSSVSIKTNPDTISTAGVNVDVVCTVELGPAVMESDISYLTVDTRLSRNGTTLALTGPVVFGTRLSYTFRIDSFERKNIGEYVCTVAVGPSQFSSPYITGSAALTTKATIAFAEEVSVCSSEVARAVGLTVGVIIVIECLIALPLFTTIVALYFKRKSSSTPKGISDVAYREAQLYEDPENLQIASSGQGKYEYELTHCPAYESAK